MIIATHIDVAAPAGQVWAIVGPGFADVAAWTTVIAHSEPTTTGDGRRCSVSGIPGVDEVVERLTAYDDSARTMTYVADTGLPGYVRHATNTWTVTPLGPDRSRVALDARVTVSGPARLAAPLIRFVLTVVGRRTLRDLRRHVERGAPAGNERRRLEATRRAGSGGDTPSSDDGRLLATAISANAVFSLASGLVLLTGAVVLAPHIGVPAWALASTGAGVVGFGALLLWLLTEPTRLAGAGRVAVAADLAWIAATAMITTIQPPMLTAAGTVALGVLTAAVAAFATAQAIGLRRIRGASATGTTTLAIRADRLLAGHRQRCGMRSRMRQATRASRRASPRPRSSPAQAKAWCACAPTTAATSGRRRAPCGSPVGATACASTSRPIRRITVRSSTN